MPRNDAALVDRNSRLKKERDVEKSSQEHTPPPGPEGSGRDEKDRRMTRKVDFAHLGELLRFLRDTYPDRTGQNVPGRPRVNLTALSLIDCLKDHGYPITSGSYSLLESGRTLPQDPLRFFEAVSKCLAVRSSDIYWGLMRQQYAFDLVARTVGPEEATRMIPHGDDYVKLIEAGNFPA